MEDLALSDFWRDRRVFLTGHTGFMGGWLASLLVRKGAKVSGFALAPPNGPSLFAALGLGDRIARSTIGDVRNREALADAVRHADPEVVFHLAAQPLVRKAHAEPVETFATNVLGSAHLLDAVRTAGKVRAVLVVTTDKVYRNENRREPYAEEDRLGGREAYSASKAATEMVTDAWRYSYLEQSGIGVATIRAGNIFGGGDWAEDRLVPDAVRAFANGRPLVLRHPQSTRPWQHVLDPLPGYLALAEKLAAEPAEHAGGWNFGPAIADCRPVGDLAELLAAAWGDGAHVQVEKGDGIFEETLLALDSSKARMRLGWQPRWPLETGIEHAIAWYQADARGDDMWSVTQDQIDRHEAPAARATT